MTEITSIGTNIACPVCAAVAKSPLALLTRMPVVGCQFSYSLADATAVERGDLDVVVCLKCGHIYNRAFDMARVTYGSDYENALDFSGRHRAHTQDVVERLVDQNGLRGKAIVEVGCGAGEFLRRICERGGNRGVGYDPSQPNTGPSAVGAGSMEVKGEIFADAEPATFDALLCQHVIEHLPQPLIMLRKARQFLVPGGFAFFEVPNAGAIFEDFNVWDLTYEHVSYFTPASLRRVMTGAGFAVAHLETTFGNQYLDADAHASSNGDLGASHDDTLPGHFGGFPGNFSRLVARWKNRVLSWRRTSRRVVLWGAGSKAVTFLNLLRIQSGRGVDYVVDINPRKAGRFIPGTGQQIVEPSYLRRYRPDVIIVMNIEYRNEIEALLREMDLNAEIVSAVQVLETTGG